MDYDNDDSHGAWQAQVAEAERQAAEERERFLAAHPGYEQCPNHPERPVVDSGCCDTRFCAECIAQRKSGWADYRPHPWHGRRDHDMRDYSDAYYRNEEKK